MKVRNYPLIIVMVAFGIIYSLISLVNHYNFRTYAFDLGLNNNALWDYLHFRWNDCMVMQPQFTNILSDHFSLTPIIISPLAWITGSYTLLIVQIAGILWGGFGIYKLIGSYTSSKQLSLMATIHFFVIWGVFSAVAFDYHDNVMGTMFVPWFLYYFHQNKWKYSAIWFILILISKENMALWAFFIGLGLTILYFKDKIKRKTALVFSLTAMVYFMVIMTVVMPLLADPGRGYLHFQYSALGNNVKEALITVITRPGYTIRLLFFNHLPDPLYDGIKAELWLAIFASGGIALLRYPAFFIMLLPVLGQKLFCNFFEYWGINNHYSIEFAPILVIALYWWINNLKNPKIKFRLALTSLLICAFTSFSFMDHRVSKHYKRADQRFYQQTHYVRNFDVAAVHHYLKAIPYAAKVSAQNMLVPHLAFRDVIYTYPYVFDADYIVLLSIDPNTYPLTREDYNAHIENLKLDPGWEKLDSPEGLTVFKRKGTTF